MTKKHGTLDSQFEIPVRYISDGLLWEQHKWKKRQLSVALPQWRFCLVELSLLAETRLGSLTRQPESLSVSESSVL